MKISPLDKLVHDCRGYLNSISMNAELCKLLTSHPDSEEKLLHAINVIIKECKNCDVLLEQYRNEHETDID